MNSFAVLVSLLVLLLRCDSGVALRVSDVDFVTPIVGPIGAKSFDPFNATLVLAEVTGCKPSDVPPRDPNASSVAIFFSKMGGCYPDAKSANARDAGYDAVLVVNDRGNLGLLRFYWHPRAIVVDIPVLEILDDDAKLLVAGGSLQVALLRDDDPNPWDAFNLVAFWPYSILIGILAAIIFGLVVFKIRAFYEVDGASPTLAMQVLLIELLSTTIRFIYVIDPHSIHHVIPWGVHEMFLTNTFTLSLATNILIMFHWLATLNKKDAGGPTLDRYKWPCYIFLAGFCLFDAVSSVFLGMMIVSAKIILIKGMIFIFTGALSAGMFIYTGIRVIRTVRKVSDGNRAILRLSIFILLTGIFLLWFTGVSMSVPFSFDTPISFYLINGLAFLATECISLLEVLSLRPRGAEDSSRTLTTKYEMEESV